MGVRKGVRQTHWASHFPLPRPVASVKFSDNKKKEGERTERRGIRKTERDKHDSCWKVSSTDRYGI